MPVPKKSYSNGVVGVERDFQEKNQVFRYCRHYLSIFRVFEAFEKIIDFHRPPFYPN